MAEVTICSDFGAPKIRSLTVSTVSLSIWSLRNFQWNYPVFLKLFLPLSSIASESLGFLFTSEKVGS